MDKKERRQAIKEAGLAGLLAALGMPTHAQTIDAAARVVRANRRQMK